MCGRGTAGGHVFFAQYARRTAAVPVQAGARRCMLEKGYIFIFVFHVSLWHDKMMEKNKDYFIEVMGKSNIAIKEKEERQVLFMKNYYSKIDNITLTFSDIEEREGFDSITFRFERPNEHGFDFAEGRLPENMIYKSYGFSEDELMQMERYLRNNSFLIWEIAREEYANGPLHLD